MKFKERQIKLQNSLSNVFEILFKCYISKNCNNLENIKIEDWCSKFVIKVYGEKLSFYTLEEKKFNKLVSKININQKIKKINYQLQ